MEVNFLDVTPVKNCIEQELIFVFEIKLNDFCITPINFFGSLFLPNGVKIGNLVLDTETNYMRSILIKGVSNSYKTPDSIIFRMSCKISEAIFNYIEKERDKIEKEDVFFNARLTIQILRNNLQVSNIYTSEIESHGLQKTTAVKNKKNLFYSYSGGNYSNSQQDMYLVSTCGNDVFAVLETNHKYDIACKITYSKWLKDYVPYFNGQKVLVYEIPVPPYNYLPKKLHSNFQKANSELTVMKKQMETGDWRSVVFSARIIYELFKNLDDFDNLLVNSGYSKVAADCMKDSLKGFFDFISKVQHGYGIKTKANPNPSINPSVEINREDATYIYVNCVSLLNLIAQKSKRLCE